MPKLYHLPPAILSSLPETLVKSAVKREISPLYNLFGSHSLVAKASILFYALFMPSPEQHYQGEHFQADLSETDTSFMAQITNGAETVIFQYTPPGKVSFEVVSSPVPLAGA